MSDHTFNVTLRHGEGYHFDVAFDDPSWPTVSVDEPEPIGDGSAPNASRLLGAAIGNCLAASLLFCLDKARIPVEDVDATVEGTVTRNEKGRLRIGSVKVKLAPTFDGDVAEGRYARCLEVFEDFCIVTQSVRGGIDVSVEVVSPGGESGLVEDDEDAELAGAGT